jgi:hypothetical protein
MDIARQTSKMMAHLSDTLFDNAPEGATPPSVEDADSSALLVGKNDRKAICSLNT